MNNKPYIFCNSVKNIQQILFEFDKIGLSLVSKTTDFGEEKWKLSCPWKSDDEIILFWDRNFWPDGIYEEDNNGQFLVNGISTGKVDIQLLKNTKLEISLSSVIIEKLMVIGSKFTGKTVR